MYIKITLFRTMLDLFLRFVAWVIMTHARCILGSNAWLTEVSYMYSR